MNGRVDIEVHEVPTREALVQSMVQLVSLPEVYYEFERRLRDPNVSLQALSDVVSADVDVSLRLLKLANSSFFGFSQRVDTINRALVLVGTQQVKDLILATAVLDQFQGLSTDCIDIKDFWRHCLATGVFARCLAIQRRERNAERFFGLGLLHDIGRMVMFLQLPDLMQTLLQEAQEEGATLTQLEFERLGYTHASVGSCLMENWELPANMYMPVAFHHDPMGNTEHREASAILHVSDIVVHALGWGHSGEPLVPKLDAEAWAELLIPTAALDSLVDRAREQYETTLGLFL